MTGSVDQDQNVLITNHNITNSDPVSEILQPSIAQIIFGENYRSLLDQRRLLAVTQNLKSEFLNFILDL